MSVIVTAIQLFVTAVVVVPASTLKINANMLEVIQGSWHQILFIIGVIVYAVRTESEVRNLRKDIEDIKKRDTYVEVVKMRAEVDVNIKQISSLWEFVNNLRDRFKNGH